ncbi:MAG TPA: hypothetical protein VF820_03030 [Patescibacteria group bacterium]
MKHIHKYIKTGLHMAEAWGTDEKSKHKETSQARCDCGKFKYMKSKFSQEQFGL